MKRHVLALLLLVATPLAHGWAGELAVEDMTFRYDELPGLCPVEPNKSAAEKVLLDSLAAPVSRVIVGVRLSIDCIALDGFRSGTADASALSRIFGVGLVLQGGKAERQRLPRQEYIPQFGDFLRRLLEGDPALEQQLKEKGLDVNLTLKGLGMDDVKALRFVGGDPDAFYVAMVFEEADAPVVFGVTLLQGYPIAAFLAGIGGGEAARDALLAELQPAMRQLIAANDPEGAAPPDPLRWLGIDWIKVAIYAIPALCLAWFFWLRQRRPQKPWPKA